MNTIRLITDPFELGAYEEHVSDKVIPFLMQHFGSWPETARLYKGAVAIENDVTPQTQEDIDLLSACENDLFYVVVYPGDPITAIIAIVASLALTAIMLLFLMPKIPTTANNNESSNNSLGSRSNKPRPNGRIPDIFGDVLSIPELLTVPLLKFDNNLEREVCLMCIGRGAYDIVNVKDGDTPLSQIAGAGARFYGPNTSPNSGSPFLQVGETVTEPLRNVVKVNDVNGQILRPPNANNITGFSNIRFVYPDKIQTSGGITFTDFFATGDELFVSRSDIGSSAGTFTTSQIARFTSAGVIQFDTYDPSADFAPGQSLTVSNAGFADNNTSGGVTYVNLDGTYTISSVSSTSITLSSPSGVNADWSSITSYSSNRTSYRTSTFSIPIPASGYNLDGMYDVVSVTATQITLATPSSVNASWANVNSLPGHATDYISPFLYTAGERWIGPFVIDMDSAEVIFANFVAQQGMYIVTKEDGDYLPHSVQVMLELTPVDEDAVATGAAQTFTIYVSGDGSDRGPRGVTLSADPTFTGRMAVRARRLTYLDLNSENTIVDEVKWRDCFGTAPITVPHFGDITTVQTLTLATSGATSVKERKFNCRATRKVLVRNIDNTFGPSLAASSNAADIICHMALDPYIGGRTLSELDVEQIYDTIDQVIDYFGIDQAGSFNYTFDQDNISFEEMVQSVAQCVFCTAYRQGSVLRLFFERATDDSTLLFNHRNKVPGSETRTVRFGNLGDNDGVEFDYVSPKDGSKLTIYLPADRSATKPKKMQVIGVQSIEHGLLHAWRAFNKIKYQHTTTQFTALSEATQLVLSERIEVTDNTRSDSIDGHVVSQAGLTLELSQPFNPIVGVTYVIQLQLPTGIVEVINILPGVDERHVVLQEAPSVSLVMGPDIWADVTYQIVGTDDVRPSAFLLTEKGAYDRSTLTLQAINYDARYYQFDGNYL